MGAALGGLGYPPPRPAAALENSTQARCTFWNNQARQEPPSLSGAWNSVGLAGLPEAFTIPGPAWVVQVFRVVFVGFTPFFTSPLSPPFQLASHWHPHLLLQEALQACLGFLGYYRNGSEQSSQSSRKFASPSWPSPWLLSLQAQKVWPQVQ